jgi:hypothetical protein
VQFEKLEESKGSIKSSSRRGNGGVGGVSREGAKKN